MPGERLTVEYGNTKFRMRELGKRRQHIGEIKQGSTGYACRHQTWATHDEGNIDACLLQGSLATTYPSLTWSCRNFCGATVITGPDDERFVTQSQRL